MSGAKLAASWGDLLLIAVLTAVGTGVCVLSIKSVSLVMNPRAPKETIERDRLSLPLLEHSLATAREDRGFIMAQRREVDMRLMRNTTTLRMGEGELGALQSAKGRADSLRRDSIGRSRAALQWSIRADSLLALQLQSKMPALDSTLATRAYRFDRARDALDLSMLRAKARHGALEKLFSTLAAGLAIALLLFVVNREMRPSAEQATRGQRTLVIPVAAILIAIFLFYQVGGLLLTLGVGAAATMAFFLWRAARAST